MRIVTVMGLLLAAVLVTVPLRAEEGQGTAAADAALADLNLGTHWYGATIDKRALIGKVVLVEIWGS